MRPLFVPLVGGWFDRFADGSKRIEWRAYGARWNERVVTPGRAVVLSRGYSGPRLHGTVVAMRIVQREHAPEAARQIFPNATQFCAIHVALNEGIESS